MRGAAARVIALGSQAQLLPALRTALATETDTGAMREEVRAVCALGEPSDDEAALAAAVRLSPALAREVARVTARVRGPLAFRLYFEKISGFPLSSADRAAFFRIASRGQSTPLYAAAAMALGRHDHASWEAILGAAAKIGLVLDSPLLIEALRSAQDPMRGEAAWYLAKAYCSRPPSNSNEMLAALTSGAPLASDGGDPESRFGAELLRRILGGAAVEDSEWIACLTTNPECHLDTDFGESPLLDYLTSGEKEAILLRNEAHRPPETRSRSATHPKAPPPGGDMRLVTGLPEGTVRDLFRIGGCESTWKTRWSSLAMVGFRRDGLPKHISLGGVPPGKACRQTAEALYLLTQAPEDADLEPDNRFTYVALFDPDSVVCSEEPAEQGAGATADLTVRRVRARVNAPRLQKKIEPVYPESSRKSGEQGVSIYEAVIGREGCVRDLRLIQSSAPMLDLSGMEAISHWKYAPATLDRKPVRVYLTVTVTYALGSSKSTRKP